MLISPSKTLFKDCAVSKNKESDQQVFLILYISLKEEIPKETYLDSGHRVCNKMAQKSIDL